MDCAGCGRHGSARRVELQGEAGDQDERMAESCNDFIGRSRETFTAIRIEEHQRGAWWGDVFWKDVGRQGVGQCVGGLVGQRGACV